MKRPLHQALSGIEALLILQLVAIAVQYLVSGEVGAMDAACIRFFAIGVGAVGMVSRFERKEKS